MLKRFLFNIFAGLSLLAAAIITWLWIESHGTWRDVGYCFADHAAGRVQFYMVSSCEGRIIFSSVRERSPNPISRADATPGFRHNAWRGKGQFWSFTMSSLHQISQYGTGAAGFRYAASSGIVYQDYEEDVLHIMMPHWALLVAALVIPAWKAVAFIRRKRKGSNSGCPTCGYDLRVHRAGDKCPECGMVITAR